MAYAWKSRWGNEPDMDKCRAGIYGRGASYQCSRKGVVEEDGMKWCRQHAPSTEKKGAEVWWERYRAERRVDDKKRAIRDAKAKIVDAAVAWRARRPGGGPPHPLADAVDALHKLESGQ